MDNHGTNFGPTSIEIIMDTVWTNPGQSMDQGMDKHLSERCPLNRTLDNVWTWTNVGQSLYLRFYGSFDGQSLDKP